MDITTVFGTVILGSNPGGGMVKQKRLTRAVFVLLLSLARIRTELLRRRNKQKSVALEEYCECIVNTWNNTSNAEEEESW